MFESSNVRALIFDLDGTLVETEHLKASAYAALIGNLIGDGSPEKEAVNLYRSIVGATDMQVCEAMIERFSLGERLDAGSQEENAAALHRLRVETYNLDFGTPDALVNAVYPRTVELARTADREGLGVAVATMSFASEASRVIEAIGLHDVVDHVVGIDHVDNPKPAPDAFIRAMECLVVTPAESLIIEDSPRGARAAAASGAQWLCVATEFSTPTLKDTDDLPTEWIVWESKLLFDAVVRRLAD